MEKTMRNNCFKNIQFYFAVFQNLNILKLNLTLQLYN